MKEIQVNVSADLVARASLCRSWEDTRYYLNGIRIQPAKNGGVIIVATDGHTLAALYDPAGYASEPVTISPNKAVVGWCQRPKMSKFFKGSARLILKNEKLFGMLRDDEETYSAFTAVEDPRRIEVMQWRDAIIDAAYPDFTRAVRCDGGDLVPMKATCFNSRYLARVSEVLTTKHSRGVSLYQRGRDVSSPAFVIPSGSEILGFCLVMPMRNETRGEMPGWYLRQYEPKEG